MNQTETGLNPMQMEAVEHTEGPLLILAGAGSGKTRVLTHRIASLIRDKGVNPWNIMAITFTNKAAGEMRERVDKIVGYGSERIWVSTFHSSCVRILRRHAERLGYANNFAIYDTDDQKSLIKDIMKRLQMDPKLYRDRAIMAAISSAKDEMIEPDQYRIDAGIDWKLQKYAAGAVIAVLKMLYMRNLRISLFKAQVFLRELFSGKFSSYRNGWVQEQNLMHFSVAVLLGMLYAHRTVWLSLF